MGKINFLYAQKTDLKSKFVIQFTRYAKVDVGFVDIIDSIIPESGINLFCVNVVLPMWLLKSECERHGKVHFFERVPQSILKGLQQEKCYLLLDNSGEGPSNQQYLRSLHELAEEFHFSPSRIVWVHQNLVIKEDYDVWLKPETSNTKGQVVNVYWHSFLVETVEQYQDSEIFLEAHLSTRSTWFLCLNNVPRPERILVLLFLLEKGLLEKGLVSFKAFCEENMSLSFDSSFPILEKRFPKFGHLIHNVESAKNLLPMVLDFPANSSKNQLVKASNAKIYDETYFSIVTESEMSSGHVRRFTEKVLKPIFHKHPFIVLGNPKTLQVLQQMGFKTFDGWIDESYDQILDKEERAELAFNEIERLTCKSLEEMKVWYESMHSVLEYNRSHLINVLPNWIRYKLAEDAVLDLTQLRAKKTDQQKGNSKKQELGLDSGLKDASIEENVKEGHKLLEAGKWLDALFFYEKALKLDPRNDQILHRIGHCHFKLNDFDAAISHLLRAVEINTKAYWSYNLLGHIYETNNRDLEAAKKAYMNAFHASSKNEVYMRKADSVILRLDDSN